MSVYRKKPEEVEAFALWYVPGREALATSGQEDWPEWFRPFFRTGNMPYGQSSGTVIDLISIGIVREDGATYYAISAEFDLQKALAHPFLVKEVLPHLDSADFWKPRSQIAAEIRDFVGTDPEFWADYASYDWVALCQLYGTMMDLPKGWPMFVRDVQQLRKTYGFPKMQLLEDAHHNALADARECHARWKYMTENSIAGYALGQPL